MAFDASQASHQALRGIVSERTKPLIAWVGAGLSAAAGLPTWAGLRLRLVDVLEDKAASMGGNDGRRYKGAADLARYEDNMWRAFEVLATNLGQTTFRDEIREAVKAGATAPVPEAYEQLWRLRLRGILSLNLDQLATRALMQSDTAASVVVHTGPRIAKLQQILTEPTRFVGYLHGAPDEVESWVFTQSQLQTLQKNESYTSFIEEI